MIDELHAEHFKVVLHIVIEGRQIDRHGARSVHGARRCRAAARRTTSGRPTARCSCYWPVHKPLFDLGVDGWWPDQGDGLDAPSRLARNPDVLGRHAAVSARTSAPFALHRNGYAGHAALRRVPLVGRRVVARGRR